MRPKRQSIIRFWRAQIRNESNTTKLNKISEEIEINRKRADERTEQYKKDLDWLQQKINEQREIVENANR
jgi:chromosome condensin MukBEF ATPase and DNA-binding subunit MukB